MQERREAKEERGKRGERRERRERGGREEREVEAGRDRDDRTIKVQTSAEKERAAPPSPIPFCSPGSAR